MKPAGQIPFTFSGASTKEFQWSGIGTLLAVASGLTGVLKLQYSIDGGATWVDHTGATVTNSGIFEARAGYTNDGYRLRLNAAAACTAAVCQVLT